MSGQYLSMSVQAMHTNDEIVLNILKKLQSWAGYPRLQQAMKRFPDLDVFLAGGIVRDTIQGREISPKDFDFFLALASWCATRGKLHKMTKVIFR
jgi:hypothetical protein